MYLTNAQIVTKFIQHEQRVDRLEQTMETQFQQLRHEMQVGFDKLIGFMIDLKQETSLMNHALSRVEKDVEMLKADVAVLKDDVSLLKSDVANLKIDMRLVKDTLKIQ